MPAGKTTAAKRQSEKGAFQIGRYGRVKLAFRPLFNSKMRHVGGVAHENVAGALNTALLFLPNAGHRCPIYAYGREAIHLLLPLPRVWDELCAIAAGSNSPAVNLSAQIWASLRRLGM
jgi:hypothetical protein